MRFYAHTDQSATLAAMLATMGHTLHTIDRECLPAKAVRAVEGEIFCRVPTNWKPALDRAGGDPRLAGMLLATDDVDFVLDEPVLPGVRVFQSSDMAGVLEFVR